jgi:hypothetical protein
VPGLLIILVPYVLLVHLPLTARTLTLAGLWLQAWTAGVLWFESNADVVRMRLIVEELRHEPPSPQTVAEKAMSGFGYVFSGLIAVLSLLVPAAMIAIKPFSSEHLRIRAELVWLVAWLLLAAFVYLSGRAWDRYMTNLRRSMDEGGDELIKARRHLRTLAFILFLVGTLFQLAAALVA